MPPTLDGARGDLQSPPDGHPRDRSGHVGDQGDGRRRRPWCSATAESAVDVVATTDGGVEVDPAALWDSVLDAATRALVAAGQPALEADRPGQPGRDHRGLGSRDRCDRSARRSCGRTAARRVCASGWLHTRPRLAEITGLELDPYFVAPKIVWWREQAAHAARRRRSRRPTRGSSTGCAARTSTDVATAGRSLLLDLDTGDVERRGVRRVRDRPCDAAHRGRQRRAVGRVHPVRRTAGAGDRCLRRSAGRTVRRGMPPAGEAKCTYGTGAFLLASTGDRADTLAATGWWAARHGRWAASSPGASTGRSTPWARR